MCADDYSEPFREESVPDPKTSRKMSISLFPWAFKGPSQRSEDVCFEDDPIKKIRIRRLEEQP